MFYKDYQADCQIIDKLIIINAGLSKNPEIIKQAGIAEELGGAAQTLYQAVSDRIKTYGIIPTLGTYFSIPILAKIWWPLGILPVVANLFGFDISGFFKSVVDMVQSVITDTGDFTKDDAARIADQSTSSLIKAASLDPLREIEKNGEIVYYMRGFSKEAATRSRSGLLNIFRGLGRSSQKVLFGGFLRWIVMSVLVGVAAFEGPKVLFGVGAGAEQTKPEEKPEGEISFIGVPQFITNMTVPKPTGIQAPKYDLPQPTSHNLKSSGRGNQYHINSSGTIWLMDNLGSVENTLVKWAVNIYPELAGREQDILNDASFNKMASIIYQVNPQGISQFFKMPPDSGMHTMKDVIDRFVGNIKANK